jgi:hypothetical protein
MEMAAKRPPSHLEFFSKVSVPLGVITTILGGGAWLTTMHNKLEETQVHFAYISKAVGDQRAKSAEYESRLSRIEGKLDIVIDTMEHHFRGQNETHEDHNRAARR